MQARFSVKAVLAKIVMYLLFVDWLTFWPCRLRQSLEVESTYDLSMPHPYTKHHSIGKQIRNKNGNTG